MRRLVLMFVLTLTVAMLPLGGLSPAHAANRYRTYVACGVSAGADPSHVCDRQERKAAFFRSRDADVQYKVCVRFPNGTRLCAAHQNAPQGQLRHVEIFSSQRGRHTVKWFVGGELINSWIFRNKNL